MKKFLFLINFVLLLITSVASAMSTNGDIPTARTSEDFIRVGSAEDQVRWALKKSVEKNGTATVANTQLPVEYKKAKHLGLFINHTRETISVTNPDFDVPRLMIGPRQYGYMPVKTIPAEIYIFIESRVDSINVPRHIKIYKDKKEHYSIMVDFGAIIN